MAEITGGQLNYVVTADVDQLKKSMSDGENRIMGFTEVAEKAGTTLQSSFDKSGSKVKDFTGIVRENISIQKQAIKELESQIKEVQNRASNMAPGIGQATILNEAKGLEKELAAEKAALADLEIAMSKTAATSTTLGTKLAEAKNHLAELNLASKEGKEVTAEQFREAEAEVKKYGEAISDTNARTKALTAGTIGSLAQGLSLVTGTMAMGTSLMGAFGGKSEELNQIMIKTQALLAATVTLQEIKNTTVQKGGVISGIMTIQEMARARATNLAAAGTVRATIAQRALNLVANANPYVLLATAIITVVGALALYAAGSSKAAKTTQELNKKMADSVAEPIIEYKKLQTQWNALGNDLKAKKKFIDENKDSFKKLGVSVNGVSDAENVFVKNSTAMVASMMMRARAAAAMELATEQYKIGLQKQLEYEKDEKVLKSGSLTQKMAVRSVRNISLLKGESLDGKDNMNSANELVRRSVGYSKSEQDFIKNSGIAPYKEIEKEKKALREKNKPTKNDVADEFLPPGSVAEIQKRLSAIDEALSKATDKSVIESLKTKRIAVAEELSEALKKIEIKSLEDRAAAQEKYSEAYNIIAELQGKEAADKMYGPLMDGAQSYYGWLTNEQDKLIQKGGLLSETDKQNLVFLTQKINEIEGKKNAFQNFTDGIDEALAKIPTLSGQLEFLQNKAEEQLSLKGNKSFDDGEQKLLKEKQDALLRQQKDNYQQFLNEHKSFEEQKDAITQKYNNLRAQAKGDKIAIAKIDKAEKDELSNLTIEIIKQSAEWQAAFGEMEYMSKNALNRILASLLEFKAKSAGTLAPTEMRELEAAIKRVEAAQQRNPFTAMLRSFSSYKTALQIVTAAQLAYNRAVAEFGRNSKEAQAAQEKLTRADIDAGKAKQTLVGSLQKGQEVFNAVGNGVRDIGDAFGGFDDATNDAIGNIMDIGNAAFDLGKSIATGDVAGMISAGIKLIGSIGKALNGDQKKEREIKKQSAALKELEKVYNDLGRAIDKALGEKFFGASVAAVNNLKQQKALLEQMMRTEQSKKKADQDKINGYKDQINSINNAIEDMQQKMVDKALNGINAQGLADKLADALTTAFQNGESAAEAMGKTVDDVLRDMVKNALKMKILEPAMQAVVDKMLASMGFNQVNNSAQITAIQQQIAALQQEYETTNPVFGAARRAQLMAQINALKNQMTALQNGQSFGGSFDGLTDEERAEIKAMMENASNNYMNALGEYESLFGSAAENAQGLKGDIKGITEKTAGALEAQINAMRIIQADMHNIGKNNQQTFIASLQMLVMIEANTRNLIQIRQDISEMNGKMSKGLAGVI